MKFKFTLFYALYALVDFLAVRRFADVADSPVAVVDNPDAPPVNETPWYENDALGVEPDMLTDKDKEYNSFGEYIKATHNARQLAASKYTVPGEDATDEEKQAFENLFKEHFSDRMVSPPESPDQYDIELLKNNEEMTDERKGEILSSFHEKGFSNEHASAAMEIYAAQMAKDIELAEQMIEQQRAASEKALQREWGGDYEDRMSGISKAEEKYPELVDALKQSGVSGRQDYFQLMDELARATDEDGTGGGSMESRMESIDTQIKAVRENPKFMKGTVFERRKLQAELEGLYKKKTAMAS